jgi:hypothetical protein
VKIDKTFWQEQNKKWLMEKELLGAKVQSYQRPYSAEACMLNLEFNAINSVA